MNKRSRAVIVFVALWLIAQSPVAAATSAGGNNAIETLLDKSVASWNHADLTAFMSSYEDSPQTTYVSSHALVRGYANIRAHYAFAYHGAMGTLSISDRSIRMLGTEYAVVVARWHLALPNGKKPAGLFSLVLHKSLAGWRIITDHSP